MEAKLPPLPKTSGLRVLSLTPVIEIEPGAFTADQMRQYGIECARQEREACAKIAESDEFYGSAVPVAIAAAIRNQPEVKPGKQQESGE